MSHDGLVPQLVLRNVQKVITAGTGVCRVRVTVLGGVSLRLMPGEALAITGALPLARSMLCAIAAGIARPDAGQVRWGPRGLSGVRYAPAGDAPRALQLRDRSAPGLVILDAALVEHAPPADIPAIATLLQPWLEAGGAAIVAAAVQAGEWPWWTVELAGGTLRPSVASATDLHPVWSAPARMVAEGSPRWMAHPAEDG